MPETVAGLLGLFVDLKRYNRAVRSQTRASAQAHKELLERLQNIDQEIQNLKYERNHYKREIHFCRSLPCVACLASSYFDLLAARK